MTEQRPQRQLSAILAADVAGYSRLIGLDEEGTLARLKELRRTVIDPKIIEHRGRIVKTMGDGLLAQFASAVDAVRCAVDVQHRMAEQNAGTDKDQRIEFRIGLNLGDVVIDGEDIHGDGVNVAARLEALAEPGGICVSGSVHDQVCDRLDFDFRDTGEHQLKNIGRPIRVYEVRLERHTGKPSSMPAYSQKPSVAVLPFVLMGGDVEQQYLSDGITEDIITELSRYRSLFVIARNSSFQYRSADVDVRRIGRELGVGFVVEGSVRRAGERLRITAQLIDAKTGDHVWADRYDRDMGDIFALQDELARTIATTLEGRVAASAGEKVRHKPTQDWKAYDHILQGRQCDHQYDMIGAEACFARAIVLDPNYGHAHAFRAIALAVMQWEGGAPLLHLADVHAQKALSIDPDDALSHQAAGYVALCQHKFDLAGIHLNRAASLNPNDTMIAADLANWLVRTGKPQEALGLLDAAMRRDPYPPAWSWEIRHHALFHLGHYDEAIAALSNIPVRAVRAFQNAYFAATCALAHRMEDARNSIDNFKQLLPGASISLVAKTEPYADRKLLEQLLDGLRKAGLPE